MRELPPLACRPRKAQATSRRTMPMDAPAEALGAPAEPLGLAGRPPLGSLSVLYSRHFSGSQTGSQRLQSQRVVRRRRAFVVAGQARFRPRPASPSHGRSVTGGQGVAGSNPAVPTIFRIFLCCGEPRGEPIFSRHDPLTTVKGSDPPTRHPACRGR
jgi:hypothetical protein